MDQFQVIAFSFLEGVPQWQQNAIREELLGLQLNCKKDGKCYIEDLTGGAQCSIEPFTKGVKYIAVVKFSTAADLDYFTHQDPIALAFMAKFNSMITRVM
ncbi:hypothetical protein FIBSPDRAFT_858425 [Athelia psychrophila]|uniref:Stress-response A/B barrel domain-containing protein n=1 Tax=Athelia psychrophila TaxID=1759441 RepID=A0A166LYV6_9AGAM|nr:hypothetical protein FIBSPDRAFT_858425 [Fibularhizoctonia sp. CBS 109695]